MKTIFKLMVLLFLIVGAYGVELHNNITAAVICAVLLGIYLCELLINWLKNLPDEKDPLLTNMDTKVLCNKRLYTIRDIINMNDDPQWDTTDAAHPAWWRGEQYSAYMASKLVENILTGRDNGKGVMNEPLETMRRSVIALKKQYNDIVKVSDLQHQTLDIANEFIAKQKETIKTWQTRHSIATEQQQADWDRIKGLEKDCKHFIELVADAIKETIAVEAMLENMKGEMMVLESRLRVANGGIES